MFDIITRRRITLKIKLAKKRFDSSLFASISDVKVSLPRMYIDSFDSSRWRAGIAIWRELGIACREADIYDQAKVLRHFAVGYIPGKYLSCRPKLHEVAVMFLINDEFCWTHLREKEFNYVFGE